MRLQVVVDNLCSRSGLLAEWGYSAWLHDPTQNINILLDTGGPEGALEHNLPVLGLEPKELAIAVLSHSHYDHVGGIDFLLKENPDLKFVCTPGIFQEKRGDANQKRINGGLPKMLENSILPFDSYYKICENVMAFHVPVEKETSRTCARQIFGRSSRMEAFVRTGSPTTFRF